MAYGLPRYPAAGAGARILRRFTRLDQAWIRRVDPDELHMWPWIQSGSDGLTRLDQALAAAATTAPVLDPSIGIGEAMYCP
jgi:hypothetical protein